MSTGDPEITVDADFVRDWYEHIRAKLVQLGDKPKADERGQDLFVRLLNIRNRGVPVRPRAVVRSRELACPPEHEDGLALFVEKAERGEDLRPHLSTSIEADFGFNDFLLNSLGVHHFHLGREIKKIKKVKGDFVRRTGPLLFARVTADELYLISITGHKPAPWHRVHFVEILHANWPEAISDFRINGVMAPRLADEERANLQSRNMNSFVQVADGTVYGLIGGGMAAAGNTVPVIFEHDFKVKTLEYMEKAVRENISAIAANLRSNGVAIGSEMRLRHQFDAGGEPATILEMTSGRQIRLTVAYSEPGSENKQPN
ncbi:hypothetical protein [Corallococcus sicarius]|uniref:hypothetical protein n=1 Tax=Corallococcus sicarius TaxID=2316726 RepID=UPI0011C41C19|nr:hypothetical protein [Corallococcus sicarius]